MLRTVVPLAFASALFVLPNAASAQATYLPVGVQSNVPVATVTGGGWTECHRETFASNANSIASISAACASSQMMMACRPVGDPNLTLLAQAPKADVMFDTGTGNVTHNANGVGWYFNNSWSWGFTTAGNAVSRNSCDTVGGTDRMCVHTGGGNTNSGYRCGNTFLNGNATWERIFYTATPAPPVTVPTMSIWTMMLLGLSLALGAFVVLRQRIFGA